MLQSLSIRNIVLIEQCDLAFAGGLCVLTGETGAGKSILLDSLGLVLGMRAEARLVRNGATQAGVTASFDISANSAAKLALTELGLEAEDEVIIRRSISPDGKTKCFVNDVPVSVAGLKALGETLVEVHGQHDGHGLLDSTTHRPMLDAYGELEKQVAGVGTAHGLWQSHKNALLAAEAALEQAAREKEYLEHMQKELGQLSPEQGEEEILADKRTTMMQGEKLADTLSDVQKELTNGKGAMGMMSTAQRTLARSSLGADGKFSAAVDALERACTSLGEAEESIEALIAASQYNPAELERIEERLFALRAAARKYNTTADGLAQLKSDVDGKLSGLREQQHTLGELQKKVEISRAEFVAKAETLRAARAKAVKKLEKAVAGELEGLKMGSTTFAIMMDALPEERWNAAGMDHVYFVASTNKGAAPAPLHKIASGGELSRFMLAMKVALAKVKSTSTLIFDEIDTGTGGAVADAIGQRLARLGGTHQVLVVTHLPQVAACGAHHLRVSKTEKKNATFTQVEVLDTQARREELARMLAGAEVTAEARKAAEKLLKVAG